MRLELPTCCVKATDQWRWCCPSCGRFVAEGAVRSWDEPDPGAYYGVRSVIEADCGRCGVIEPRYIPTTTHECEAA